MSEGYNYSAGERFDLINVLENEFEVQLVFIREQTGNRKLITIPKEAAREMAGLILRDG